MERTGDKCKLSDGYYRKQDALYPVVMSLKGKEQRVLDDGHGRMDCLYTAIVDKRITANGFQCRWRKGKIEVKVPRTRRGRPYRLLRKKMTKTM